MIPVQPSLDLEELMIFIILIVLLILKTILYFSMRTLTSLLKQHIVIEEDALQAHGKLLLDIIHKIKK